MAKNISLLSANKIRDDTRRPGKHSIEMVLFSFPSNFKRPFLDSFMCFLGYFVLRINKYIRFVVMRSFREYLEDKEYTALVQHPRTKEFKVIQKKDSNLTSFKDKLKAKGYRVVVAEDQVLYKIPDSVEIGDIIDDGKSKFKVAATDKKYITAYDEVGNRLLINKYRFNTIRVVK